MIREDALKIWNALDQAEKPIQNGWNLIPSEIELSDDEERTLSQMFKCMGFDTYPISICGDWLVGEFISPIIWRAAHPTEELAVFCAHREVFPPEYNQCSECGIPTWAQAHVEVY